MGSLGEGCVNFFLPITIHRWTGSQTKPLWFNIQAEGQGSLRQTIVYKQYPFSEQKQPEAKVKVKETTNWTQNWLLFAINKLRSNKYQTSCEEILSFPNCLDIGVANKEFWTC